MKASRRPPYSLFALVIILAAALIVPLLGGVSPIDLGLDLAGGVTVTYRPDFDRRVGAAPPPDEAARAELLALAKETLASRLTRSLSTVPDVVVRDDETLVVAIPGVQDHRQVLELVGKTYRLTFRLVAKAHDGGAESPDAPLYPYAGQMLELEPAIFSGEMLDPRSLRVETGSSGTFDPEGDAPRVAFRFESPHDEAFGKFTSSNIGRQLAILLDDEVEWAGRIESEIRGSGVLRGAYDLEEATNLTRMLRSGSLPISLTMESLTAVGPSLGQEVQELGRSALLLSMALLVGVLIFAYAHRSWLLVTGVLSLGFLLLAVGSLVAIFDLTVDLAGIAGLVLSIGMGMDAFILIFEALDRRLSRATSGVTASLPFQGSPGRFVGKLYSFAQEGRVLFHANATTALVMMLLLTGDRLRSFALFIFVGIAASVLTIFTTRALLARTHGLLPDLGIDLLSWVRGRRPGVLRWRWLYGAAVAASIILTLGLAFVGPSTSAPSLELGSDFEAGTQLILTSDESARAEAALRRLQERLPGVDVRQQTLGDPADGRSLVTLGVALSGEELANAATAEAQIQPGENWGPLTVQELVALMEAESVTLESAASIDSRVSSARLLRSLSVFILSFFLLALYFVVLQGPINGALTTRKARPMSAGSRGLIFLGILLAVVLDVTLILVFLAHTHIAIDLAVVAALLTVIGYSVNDSVVLWSHVRNEHLRDRARRQSSIPKRVSDSVDSILSRAGLTSLSTMVPAIAILLVGLRPLEGFAWVMIVGTLAGTLSSLFIVGGMAVRALERETRGAPATVSTPVTAP
ncbi:MAG: hypothetical protein AAF560_09950 [Acidobacteriota bacterium]